MPVWLNIELESILQLILALFLGVLIGVERNLARKWAGMRTFGLVSLGAALFSMISIDAGKVLNGSFAAAVFDPTRIAAQIVTGVGFIGAGIMFFSGTKMRGITTAAGLWIAAAIGMAVGFRFYVLAVVATFLTLIVFYFLWSVEENVVRRLAKDD